MEFHYSWAEFAVFTAIGFIGYIALILNVLGLSTISQMEGAKIRPDMSQYTGLLVWQLFQILIAASLGQYLIFADGFSAPLVANYISKWDFSGDFLTALTTGLHTALIPGAILGAAGIIVNVSIMIGGRIGPQIGAIGSALFASLQAMTEEITIDLLGISLFTFLLSRIWHTSSGAPATWVIWLVISLVALIAASSFASNSAKLFNPDRFGSVHLVLGWIHAFAGYFVFAYLFWHYGLEVAIFAHVIQNFIRGLVSARVV